MQRINPGLRWLSSPEGGGRKVEGMKEAVKAVRWGGKRTDREDEPPAGTLGPGADSLDIYLNEVSRWDLLSPEAERALARRTAKGDPAALDELVNRNLRLVVHWARRYSSSHLPMQDLIQEGNMGLMRAARKFDPRKGTRFSTYATWWIKQALARAVYDKADLIRVPVHMHQKMRQVRRLLGETEESSSAVKETIEESGIVAYEEWDNARQVRRPISLDGSGDPDDDGAIEVEDSDVVDPERKIYLDELRESIEGLLDALPPRHGAVLKLRFGLAGTGEHTLEAIGSRLKLSRERIRQIEADAIRRLAGMMPDFENGH